MAMTEGGSWEVLRDRRLADPEAAAAYEEARLAHDLGAAVRALRLDRSWTQQRLATEIGTTQSAVARLEAGGTMPTLTLLGRIARALDADLDVSVRARRGVA